MLRPGALETRLAGEEILLLPSGGIVWPQERTLFVADIHVGKGAAFRSFGLAIPSGTTRSTLDKLSVDLQPPIERLVILGDLWHARQGRTPEVELMLEEWRDRNSEIHVVLVEGNHDRRSGPPRRELRFEVVDEGHRIGPFLCRHHPAADPQGYVLAGHLHPAMRLEGRGRQSLRLPCFWLGPTVGVLPAYGDFTGASVIDASTDDRIFVLTGEAVLEVRR